MKTLPVTGHKPMIGSIFIYTAQPSKVELFLKVKVRRPSA